MKHETSYPFALSTTCVDFPFANLLRGLFLLIITRNVRKADWWLIHTLFTSPSRSVPSVSTCDPISSSARLEFSSFWCKSKCWLAALRGSCSMSDRVIPVKATAAELFSFVVCESDNGI